MAKRTIKDVIARLHELSYHKSFFTDPTQTVAVSVETATHKVHQRWPHCKAYRSSLRRATPPTEQYTWATLEAAPICEECWSGKPLASFLAVGAGYAATPLAAAWAMDQTAPKLASALATVRTGKRSVDAPKLVLRATKLLAAASTLPHRRAGKSAASPWHADYEAQLDSCRNLLDQLAAALANSDPTKDALLAQVRRYYTQSAQAVAVDDSPCLVVLADRATSFDFPQTEKLIHQLITTFTVPHHAGRPVLAVPRYVADYLLVSLPNHPRKLALRVTRAPDNPALAATAVALWDPEATNATSDLATAVATAELLATPQSSNAS